ncbi:isoleucine--tRNA ligase [Natranaerobius thermophilus]|uniref:Isoleucine--tRNA ligase n=1 Tax=Natranaerobius thermophilus (strain ATCC BAA-1301 / DSM 18059 / JW/NM-WN-LF) TaxID=457570 RepID=SYI_NATTJ|nr:isoleucine--tRNA ligase [Natranaerobius thermophilus]B2A2I8.1 RecName: Full=Isoleucine--tRNA ligase; AltName: Full=Isoleucyl-tRNA synthetase; Short=IleRS [Natranaerobius thermophilus JW/NM-WN-LF]ACB84903.1 Isoleucyl-tRNA synthetase [Natranaerobius thermophilus JW/NM-WN-LF]
MNYKDTLNLPKTDFPMKAKLPSREPEFLQEWESNNLYQRVQQKRSGKPKYILHDGPPYANGNIHMGHALNKVLKDIVVKFKTMQGYDSPYVPGWDTHGLPIEHQITKTEKVDRKSMSDVEFRKKCHDYAMKYVEIQKEEFKRLGVRGDWDNPYLTLSPEFEAEQVKLFGEMAQKGYIYKGLKPVYWCTDCETALAEAEVEYHDKRSPSIYVGFHVKDSKGEFNEEGVEFIIWTTTPWTIPANMAIALHPEFQYSLIKSGEKHYIVATDLLETVAEEAKLGEYQIIREYTGRELEGIVCQHPLFDSRESLVILGDHVTLEQGTGCVHTAPGHGHEDYEVAQKYDLEVLSPLNDSGVFTEEAGQFQGLYYDKANKEITQALDKRGALLSLSFITHQYPCCWRCKESVIFRATEQWFASVDGFRQDALKAIEDVDWIPAWGEERIKAMVMNRGDWCISRQRVWGVPLPIFYCQECGHELITEESISAVAELFRQEGSDAWFEKEAPEILPQGIQCSCGAKKFSKETDIMDVWFDSGSTHRGVCAQRQELAWPVDLYLEGSDQYRGWFQSSLLTAVATKGESPYRECLTNGWVVDGEGKKMSKSQGNVIAPQDITNQYGADILRLWVASSEFKQDVRVSQKILKQTAEAYRKIRNTARFILGNLYDFTPEKDYVSFDQLEEIDSYILCRLQKVIDQATRAYDEFEFHEFYHLIHNFCVVELSQFYLDVIKDRIYTMPTESRERRAAQTTMYYLLDSLVKMLAPVLTFTSEEIWQYLPGDREESIQLTDWPEVNEELVDNELEQKWANFLEFRKEVAKALENARKDKKIGSSLESKILIYADEDLFKKLQSFEDNLEELFIVSQVELKKAEQLTETVKNQALSSEDVEQASIIIEAAQGEKCPRCWNYHPEVTKAEELCPRCSHVLETSNK